jgi:hypothetical protein
MSDKLPVVRIKTANGPVIINEADFDPAKHERADAPAKPAAKKRGRSRKAKE